jgi:hypothetical protein
MYKSDFDSKEPGKYIFYMLELILSISVQGVSKYLS